MRPRVLFRRASPCRRFPTIVIFLALAAVRVACTEDVLPASNKAEQTVSPTSPESSLPAMHDIAGGETSLPQAEPMQMDPDLREAVLLFGDGEYETALVKLQTAEKNNPQDANVYYYKGEVYAELDEGEKAVSAYLHSLELNPNFQEVHRKLGIAWFRGKQYRRAADELDKAIAINPEDVQALYYLGMTNYYLKAYYRGVSVFRKARALNPDLTLNYAYWEGVCLFNDGLYHKAEQPLLDIRKGPDEFPLKNSAEEFLAQAREYEKPWQVQVNLWAEYDDNVVLQSETGGLVTEISRQADWRLAGDLDATYRIFREEGQYGIGGSFYQSVHGELTDYNLQGGSFSAYFLADARPWQPEIRYSYAHYLLGGNGYLQQNSVTPSLSLYQWSPARLHVYWTISGDDYLGPVESPERNQDAINNVIGVSYQRAVQQDNGSIRLGVSYENNNAEGTDWDYGGVDGFAQVYLTLPNKIWAVRIQGDYFDSHFQHIDSLFGLKRADTRFTGRAGLIYRKSGKWNITLEYCHTTNNSTLDFYHYQRNITSLFYTYHF